MAMKNGKSSHKKEYKKEHWRIPMPSSDEEMEVYDLYEPVTEDEFFDFTNLLEDNLAEGVFRQIEEILGENGKFSRKLWLRTQGIDIYLIVEKK